MTERVYTQISTQSHYRMRRVRAGRGSSGLFLRLLPQTLSSDVHPITRRSVNECKTHKHRYPTQLT